MMGTLFLSPDRKNGRESREVRNPLEASVTKLSFNYRSLFPFLSSIFRESLDCEDARWISSTNRSNTSFVPKRRHSSIHLL